MKKLNEIMVTDLLLSMDIHDDTDLFEIYFYSKHKYANCDRNITIGSFISLERIGSFLLTQKLNAYKVKDYGKIQVIEIYCSEI